MSPLLLGTLWACATQAEPPPAAEPPPQEQAVPQVLSIELRPDQPVEVPELGVTVTLTDVRTTLHREEGTGRKVHRDSGTIRFQAGEEVQESTFGRGEPLSWRGHRVTVRGSRGSYEVLFRPPAE